MILAGDVGGTKVALALVEPGNGRFRVRREARFETSDYGNLAAVLREFLGGEQADAACFGVAAPILSGSPIEMTNLDWTFDQGRLAAEIGIERVSFINDLAATALGIDALDADAFAALHEGTPRGDTAAIIAAGTGLGMAILTGEGGSPRVMPSEGGHQAFAPRTDLESELLAFLRGHHPDHVSAERVVSGPGIQAVYEFLRESGREEEPRWLAERLADSEDRSLEISRAALAGRPPICVAALKTFAGCYGSAAGDLALAALALRGIYVAGGIAPDILPILRAGPFMDAFRAKGRMGNLLADVPVFVLVEPLAPLLGAARWASLVAEAGRPRKDEPRQ
ncbi:MAG: glucokinase [Gemmatimonadota bacterium]